MATKRELTNRWSQEPGKTIIEGIITFCSNVQTSGHGRIASELFALLDGLPYREEIANGRDLRGARLGGGVHELDLSGCDFSYARLEMNFVNCDLTEARFDHVASGANIFLKNLKRASFKGSKLRGCFFENAQAEGCCFDQAVLAGASFAGTDLTGSSFREANCTRAKFLRAKLTGCDFRGAQLNEAVLQEAVLDKTTDLRGASLVNLYNQELRDAAGNLVARETDWRKATFDASTVFGRDPLVTANEIIDATSRLISNRTELWAIRLKEALRETQTLLRHKYHADWYENLIANLPPLDQPAVEEVMSRAMESLL